MDRSLERDFGTLELEPDASPSQVISAYVRLKKLYSGEAGLLLPIARDLPEERRLEILLEIEEAYKRLQEHFREETVCREPGTPAPPASSAASYHPPSGRAGPPAADAGQAVAFSGPVLKKIREGLGIPLHLIFQTTKIRVEQLEAVEEEQFAKLPDEAYLKAHLKEIAACLFLNPHRVVNDYLKRFLEWKAVHRPEEKKKKGGGRP